MIRRLHNTWKPCRRGLFLLTWLLAAWLPLAMPHAALAARPYAAARQEGTTEPKGERPPRTTPIPTPTQLPSTSPEVQAIFDRMTVADKIGQLFLVTFMGDDVSGGSDIATLVRDYRVGGVVLQPVNGNIRSVPVDRETSRGEAETAAAIAPPIAVGGEGQLASPAGSSGEQLSTPQQILRLSQGLQGLALSPPRPITSTANISATLALSVTVPLTSTIPIAPASQASWVPIPLLVGVDWAGDDSSIFAGSGGFTPIPSEMAVGATWSPALAEKTGQVVGQELKAAGVNLLLGPTLDVLNVPRPGNKGDLDTRSFGGDPFWVGQLGQAFIRGIQSGGEGQVMTAAKHFPGQGGSDRRPEDEVATVQKSMQELRQIELAPFAAVATGSDLRAPGTTAALMTSHIRYRGFQGNIRQLTPPISLAPQLQDLMGLKEFADWRAAGGVLISDALGVPALRRYYDPALQKFPHRQVAQDAFLAGNDLLYLSRFALTDNWPQQFQAIKETILFFQDKYRSDREFQARVDAAVKRIIRLKLDLYGGNWQAEQLRQHDPDALDSLVGLSDSVTQAVARSALTLIYPGPDEFADRMPTAPLADEHILIITDARTTQECADCPSTPLLAPTALQDIILRLYGPASTGQVSAENIRSLTFTDLNRLLNESASQAKSIEDAIAWANWIVFAHLDYNPDEYPDSAALRNFLAKRSDSLRDKRLIAMSFSAPYYLDTTEISKLTAYFGIYGKSLPFLETAVRALFREFSPVGAPPVSISGINYELIKQLEPAAGQIIALAPVVPSDVISSSIQVGSQLALETGIILDRKGHAVPDGTPVEFQLVYPAEGLELAPRTETTTGGKAQTTITLDRPGDLWVTVGAGEAKDSTRVELKVGGDRPGSIATVMPSPTPTTAPTPTPEPTITPTRAPEPSSTPVPPPIPEPPAPKPRVGVVAFLFALAGTVAASGAAFALRRRLTPPVVGARTAPLVAALWAALAGWVAYLLYAVGWLPGATWLQAAGLFWVAGALTLACGMLSLLWSSYGTLPPAVRSPEGSAGRDISLSAGGSQGDQADIKEATRATISSGQQQETSPGLRQPPGSGVT
jgi:beta-N-acetylhexosaminidase